MITKKHVLSLGLFLVFSLFTGLKAQNCIAVILNEYSATNVPSSPLVPNGGYPDADGQLHDWVELKCKTSGSVDIGGYFLSNDKNNIFKWEIPKPFAMFPDDKRIIFLSGKNGIYKGEFHANFTLDQCKNQYLILSTPQGVVRDSIFIQQTGAYYTRGRVDCEKIGIDSWRLYPTHSALSENPTANVFRGYCPTPKLISSTMTNFTQTPNTGGFYTDGSQMVHFKMNGLTFDTAYFCYDILYTLDGSYPRIGPDPEKPWANLNASTKYYGDSASNNFTIDKTTMVRFIAIPKNGERAKFGGCQSGYLPSFCETNTYFIDPEHNLFDPNFGVVSMAIDPADTSWFNSNGVGEPTVHVEYYDQNKQMSEGYAKMYRPFNEEWATAQKGYYVHIDDRLGVGCNFEGKVFNVEGLGTTDRTVFPQLHIKGGDVESHSAIEGVLPPRSAGTGLRDVFYQSLAAKYDIKVNPLHVKPVIGFVNGDYWGVYDLREIYDKYYEAYYNKQPQDSLNLLMVHKGSESHVRYWDGTVSNVGGNFETEVYNIVRNKPMNGGVDYNTVMSRLDKESFIDYMIMNSYANNSDVWANNIAIARGVKKDLPGGKWHFYLWNTPAIFNYNAIQTNSMMLNNSYLSPCYIHDAPAYSVSTPKSLNAMGMVLKKLMNPVLGNADFRLQYRNRYQDLLNGPLKCDNILKHYDYIVQLYYKEMRYHEDPASTPDRPKFAIEVGVIDSNTYHLRNFIGERCNHLAQAFSKSPSCYGLTGPYPISVDVRPAGAGLVKLNSTLLTEYKWFGNYFSTRLSFKAIPASDQYTFDHWEFVSHTARDPLGQDSVGIDFNQAEDVVAVFTDKSNPLAAGANIPTGFTPNGDGFNEVFKPLGSGEFVSEYQMTIFNRWGQEVFRSTEPSHGWDGYYKGQPAVNGVYAYIISYRNIYNELKSVKGNVTLTR